MKKLIMFFIMFFAIAMVYADTGDLGGPQVAVRDYWNDAEFLPGGVAFLPNGGELKFDFSLTTNMDDVNKTQTTYNTEGLKIKEDSREWKDSYFSPLPYLKARMRMGALAFMFHFKSPIMQYKTSDTDNNDHNLINPGTDYSKSDEEDKMKNGFPMDFGLKLGFAFSEKMGIGLTFSYNKSDYTEDYSDISEDENGITSGEKYSHYYNTTDLHLGMGFVLNSSKMNAGLGIQMVTYKLAERETLDASYNTSTKQWEDNWIDDKNDYPINHVKLSGFRINGITRIKTSEHLTIGFAGVFDHFNLDVESEAETMTIAGVDDSYINDIILMPGVWYKNGKFQLASDLGFIIPFSKINSLDYPDGPTKPAIVDNTTKYSSFIILYKLGALYQFTDRFAISFGLQRMTSNVKAEQDSFKTTSGVYYNNSNQTITVSNITFLSSNAWKFTMFYRLTSSFIINYRIEQGIFLDENNPNMLPSAIMYLIMSEGNGYPDPTRTLTNKLSVSILF